MKTKLILDVHKAQYAQLNSMVMGRVGDKASNTVDVYVVDGFVPYNLTGSDVYFECAKPDNTSVRDKNGIVMIDASKGHFEYTFPAQTFAAVGKSKQAYFTVEKNSTVKATTQDFIIVSIPDALTNRIPSQTYISQLEELIWQLEQIELDLLNSAAYQEAHDAKIFAEQAKMISESVKAQLDQIVIQGSIDPETKQARVDENGVAFPLLKDRIDSEANKRKKTTDKLDKLFLSPKDYGATGGGVIDDGPAIKNAHIDANTKGIPVIYDKGATYYISDVTAIPVQTSVDFNGSTLIFDLTKNPDANIYIIKPTKSIISLTPSEMTALAGKIKPGVKNIPELAGKGEGYVFAQDSNKRTYIRYGGNANNGQAMTEWFMINNKGDVLSPIYFTLETVTSASFTPSEDTWINIENVNVKTRGLITGDDYSVRNFRVERSKVNINNFKHEIENNVPEQRPSVGILQIQRCGFINLNNVTLNPRFSHGNIGTYDLSTNYTCNLTMTNVQGFSMNPAIWGVFGGNQMKDLIVRDSSLNRIDSHNGSYNILVENCRLGYHGITLTGFGDLIIRNTELNSKEAIVLRADYGSLWDGDIYLENVIHNATENGYSLINFAPELKHNFGYPLRVGKNIVSVKNYHVNNVRIQPLPLIYPRTTMNGSEATIVNECVVADRWEFENLTCTQNGFNLFGGDQYPTMRASKPFTYILDSFVSIRENYKRISHNIEISMTNVKFQDVRGKAGNTQSNIFQTLDSNILGGRYDDNYLDINTRLLPKLNIRDCSRVSASTLANPFDLLIENTEVGAYVSSYYGGSRSKAIFNNCKLVPINDNFDNVMFDANMVDTFFNNCMFKLARYGNGAIVNQSYFLNWYQILPFGGKTSDFIKQGCNASGCTLEETIDFTKVKDNYVDFGYDFGNFTYKDYTSRKSGPTSSRPSTYRYTGISYYDTDIKSFIVWNGTQWVNSLGIQPTDNTDWTNLTTSFGTVAGRPMRYKKFNGFITITGSVSSATNGTVFATLPVGFRPIQDTVFVVMDASGSKAVELTIRGDGGMVLQQLTNNATVHMSASFVI